MNPANGIVFQYKPREGAEELIYQRISDITISMKALDYLHMPDCVPTRYEVEMNTEERTNDVSNRYSQTLTVIPLTSKMKKLELPTHVVLTKDHCEMLRAEQMEDSVLLVEQITTIDRSALYNRLCRVTSAEKKQEIERAVARQFDMKHSAENTEHHHDGKEV